MTVQTFTVDFHNHHLTTLKHDGVIFVAMKPIVEGIGLDWGGQQQKLREQERKFNCRIISMTANDGKQRKMLCIPLDKVNEFLTTINPNKRKPSKEADYIMELGKQLINNGWNIELEKQVLFGKIDIFASRSKKKMIIEAKLFARAYTSALGQLLAYKESFPNARLVFACKENLNSKKKKLLNRYGIKTISSIEDLSI